MQKNSSKDLSDEEAFNALVALETEKEIRAFTKGEERDLIMDAAVARINELSVQGTGVRGQGVEKQKQGEQSGPITKSTGDFKVGIEGTKALKTHVTIDDVLAAKRKEGREI